MIRSWAAEGMPFGEKCNNQEIVLKKPDVVLFFLACVCPLWGGQCYEHQVQSFRLYFSVMVFQCKFVNDVIPIYPKNNKTDRVS